MKANRKKDFVAYKKSDVVYLRMALALFGISCNDINAEMVISAWQMIKKKGGEFNIEDAVNIEWNIRKKYQRVRAVNVTEKKSQ